MDTLLFLAAVLVVPGTILFTIVLPILAIVRAKEATKKADGLVRRLDSLERAVVRISKTIQSQAPAAEPEAEESGTVAPAEQAAPQTPVTEPAETVTPEAEPAKPAESVSTGPRPTETVETAEQAAPVTPVTRPPTAETPPAAEPKTTEPATTEPASPPAPGATTDVPPPPRVQAPAARAIQRPHREMKTAARPATTPGAADVITTMKGSLDWEQFMGARLFAWIGGLALFLGVAYFVRYSFERGWIPPEARVALGFMVGLGLIGGGLSVRGRAYTTTSRTLCATGILVLYTVTFACRAVYHFAFFGTVPTFVLMAMITAAAFVLAVRTDAMVIAILGLLGGFLTPLLLSTGEDLPIPLFGYIAMLDVGLIAVTLNRRWFFLMPAAATGTVLMQVGWAAEFFRKGAYFSGDKVLLPMAVLLGFNVLWLGATRLARTRDDADRLVGTSAVALAFVSYVFALYFLNFDTLAERPWLIFGFALLVDGVVIALTLLDRRMAGALPAAGIAMFLFLALWLSGQHTSELLWPALVFTFVFGTVHSLLPLAGRKPGDSAPSHTWTTALFPPVALGVLLIPIFRFEEFNLLIWPVILLLDAVALVLAVLTASVVVVPAVMVLTFMAAAGVLFNIPPELTGLSTWLFIVAMFAVSFVVAGSWLARKLPASGSPSTAEGTPDSLTPGWTIMLSFMLLLLMVVQLRPPSPTPVFAVALLLTGLSLAVTRFLRVDSLPVITLASVLVVESAWHFRLFQPGSALTPLAWYLGFLAVFMGFPFLQIRQFEDRRAPWIASALAGPVQFFLIYHLVDATWPNDVMGLLPAAFALPAIGGLALLLRRIPTTSPARLTQLSLYGGVALFFITLILPIQFDREWLTIGWALEGAALCWLLHRVPHPGLKLVGVALLVTAFARLTLNPAVLTYHPRADVPILNWYLYAYGLVTVSLFVGARLLAPPRHLLFDIPAPALLATLGAVLAFLLVNIEIADFFTQPGARALTFQFSGNFARDMTYSIAWALFALVLLIVGLSRKLPPTRYAGIGLLGVTILKLFFHDLASLQQLYRVGALVGVAVIAIVVSFLYQRFMANSDPAHNAGRS